MLLKSGAQVIPENQIENCKKIKNNNIKGKP